MVSREKIYEWLADVADPEVPVLSILDLGIVREVSVSVMDAGTEAVKVIITPTYSGCPAMDVIAMQIRLNLLSHGIKHVTIDSRLSPAWTTDWMTENGKRKLTEYGIAPPVRRAGAATDLFEEDKVPCPRCGSADTQLSSQFGPTACKSLYRCNSCLEPFEHFKCH